MVPGWRPLARSHWHDSRSSDTTSKSTAGDTLVIARSQLTYRARYGCVSITSRRQRPCWWLHWHALPAASHAGWLPGVELLKGIGACRADDIAVLRAWESKVGPRVLFFLSGRPY